MASPSRIRAVLLCVAAALLLGAAPAAAVRTVTIKQLMFGPVPTDLRVGDAVDWVNADIFTHSATAKDKSFDVELKPGAHARIVLTQAGTVPFICRYHPGMAGTLVVRGG